MKKIVGLDKHDLPNGGPPWRRADIDPPPPPKKKMVILHPPLHRAGKSKNQVDNQPPPPTKYKAKNTSKTTTTTIPIPPRPPMDDHIMVDDGNRQSPRLANLAWKFSMFPVKIKKTTKVSILTNQRQEVLLLMELT